MTRGKFLFLFFCLYRFALLGQDHLPRVADTTISQHTFLGYKLNGKFAIQPTYSEAHPFIDGLALVREKDFYTYIDSKGRRVDKKYFVDAKDFSEGLAAVKMSTGWGFVNTHLNTVIPAEYQRVTSFSEGKAAVKKKKWNFINRKNESLFAFESDTVVANFSNGAAIVGVQKDGWRYGLMSAKGKWLVQPTYVSAQLLAKGLFSAETEDGHFCLLNSTGSQLLSHMEFVKQINDTAFLFEKEGFRNVFNQHGAVIFKHGFKEMKSNGTVHPFTNWKLVDTTWREMMQTEADSFSVLGNVLVRHLNDKKQVVWPKHVMQWWDTIVPFSASHWKVRRKGKWSLAAKDGTLKWPFIYDTIYQHGSYWWLSQNGRTTLFDTLGQPVLRSSYDWLVLAPSGRLFFKEGRDSCGYFQGPGTKRLVTGYDSLSELGWEFFLGWKNGEVSLLNDTFQPLTTKKFLNGKRPVDTLLVLFDRDSVYRYDLCLKTDTNKMLRIRRMINDTLAWARNDTLSGIYHLGSDSLYRIDADTIWRHPDLPTRFCIKKGDTLALADLEGRWQSSYNRNLRYIGRLENGYLRVIAKKRSGFADTNGFIRISTQYDSVGKPSQGYFAVKIKTKWGVVDYKERFVIHPNYSKAGMMHHGKIAMWTGNLAMLIDKNGQELFNPRFHDIQPTLFGYWKTRKSTNYGFLDADAKEVLTPRFEHIEALPMGYFIVRQYGKVGIFDTRLKEVWQLKEKEICHIKHSVFFAIKQ